MSAINSGDERAQWNAMRRLSEVSDELPTNMCFLCSLQWQCYQCTGVRVVQWWSSEQVKSALALSCPNEENRRGAVVVVVVTSYQTGVSVIVGSSLGLTKASGVIEVMLIVPSMLFGDTELRDWPATIDSEPMLPEMKGASAPKLRMPCWCKLGPSCMLGADAGGGGGWLFEKARPAGGPSPLWWCGGGGPWPW